MQKLTEKELHQLAMTAVGKSLEADGFEFLAVNSEAQKDPHICVYKRENPSFCGGTSCTLPKKSKRLR